MELVPKKWSANGDKTRKFDFVIRISYAVASQENNTATDLFPRFLDTNENNDIKLPLNSIII